MKKKLIICLLTVALLTAAFGITAASADWVQDGTGWWYDLGGGNYPSNGWYSVGGKWYAFDASGYMKTGWYTSGGSTYYLGASGAMVTGWQNIGGSWYFFNADGALQTGWLQQIGRAHV